MPLPTHPGDRTRPRPAAPPAPRATARPAPLGALGAVVGASAVLATGALWWAVAPPQAPAWAQRPVVLPESVAGYLPLPADLDFGRDTRWRDGRAEELAGAAFAGRAYSPTGEAGTPVLNVSAGRTGAAGFADRVLAAGGEQRHGEVTCTRTIALDGGAPGASETVVVCWRSSARLTVTVTGLGRTPGLDAVAAAAVSQVWTAVS
ncbi:hypothetical protein NUM3379_21340 [Kineococcus sp. NUM-3379]